MKDNKKRFISESLNHIDDKYIEESISYKKNKFNNYRQILGFVAGFIIVVGGMSINKKYNKNLNELEQKPESVQESSQLDNKTTEDIVVYSNGVKIEETNRPKISVDMESNMVTENIGRIDPYYFRSKNIVRGIIEDIKYYKISAEAEIYISLVTIKTTKVYNGDMEEEIQYKIYVPDVLNELQLDRQGIFIVDKSTEETGINGEDSYFSYADLSDYHMEILDNAIFIQQKTEDESGMKYMKDLDYIEENLLSILE